MGEKEESRGGGSASGFVVMVENFLAVLAIFRSPVSMVVEVVCGREGCKGAVLSSEVFGRRARKLPAVPQGSDIALP